MAYCYVLLGLLVQLLGFLFELSQHTFVELRWDTPCLLQFLKPPFGVYIDCILRVLTLCNHSQYTQ